MQTNKSTVCPEWSAKIEEFCGRCFCTKCGREYDNAIVDVGNEASEHILPKHKGEP